VTTKSIVVDANILIRAVLGVRARHLIDQYGMDITFYTPDVAFHDSADHLPPISVSRNLDLDALLDTLNQLRLIMETVPTENLEPLRGRALKRIGRRDPSDWPFVAAALALDCPIWTEDQDFFGAGVATWTSDRVEIYLRGE